MWQMVQELSCFQLFEKQKYRMPLELYTRLKQFIYPGACEMEGYTQDNGRPSERILWNILNNCPASQMKSFAGLDNVASDGSDSFDRVIKICKTLENKRSNDLVKELTEGRRYLKGNYRAHCCINGCKGITDHCIKYALSDEKESSYKSTCGENMIKHF